MMWICLPFPHMQHREPHIHGNYKYKIVMSIGIGNEGKFILFESILLYLRCKLFVNFSPFFPMMKMENIVLRKNQIIVFRFPTYKQLVKRFTGKHEPEPCNSIESLYPCFQIFL